MLSVLGLDVEQLQACDRDAQFAVVRKTYLQLALRHHPDKGGNAETFREISDAFEALKAAHAAGAPLSSVGRATGKAGNGNFNTPSSEWYKAAFDDTVPGYTVERARSDRSTCTKSKEKIPKGAVRCGSLEAVSGSYGRWSILENWRVPACVHLALPTGADAAAVVAALQQMDSVVLVGFAALDDSAKLEVAAHVADPANHAKVSAKAAAKAAAVKANAKPEPAPTTLDDVRAYLEATAPAPAPADAGGALARPTSGLPQPGVGGCAAGQLNGACCVLTGVFDLSGGVGFQRGKDGAKAFIVAHGGRVVGSISKKTAYLVVGRLPGADKLCKARASGAALLSVETLAAGLRANDVAAAVAAAGPLDVDALELSRGFGGNAKRLMPPPAVEPSPKKLKM